MQTDYPNYFPILHRRIFRGSGAIKFTGVSKCCLLSTVKFSGLISLSIRGYKINKIIKLLNKINSTGSYTRDMVVKILSKPRYGLNMFLKNYQLLLLQDILIMHLNLH